MTTPTIQTRNQRIEHHLRLVTPIASGFARRTGHCSDDLVQVGMLGLIRAADRFNALSKVPFPAFARPHIRGAILHYLRDQAPLVRLPRRVEERAQKLLREGLEAERPDDSLVLSHYRGKSRWSRLPEDLADASVDSLESLHTDDRYRGLKRAMRRLPPQERMAIQTVVLQGKSLRKAGLELDLSAMTVQRRLKQGLKRLSQTA